MPENFNAQRHDEKFLRLVVVTILLMTDVGNRKAAEYSRDVVTGKGKPCIDHGLYTPLSSGVIISHVIL